MKNKNYITFCFFLLCLISMSACSKGSGQDVQPEKPDKGYSVKIPVGENSFVIGGEKERSAYQSMILYPPSDKKDGICDWNDQNAKFSLWFKLSKAGKCRLGISVVSSNKPSVIKISVPSLNFSKDVEIPVGKVETDILPVGDIVVSQPGYLKVEMEGVSKQGDTFGELRFICLGGDVTKDKIYFTDYFHSPTPTDPDNPSFCLRGPSVHLGYNLPDKESLSPGDHIEYLYNEVTVPDNDVMSADYGEHFRDPVGSYYMACGFNGGYCGMQRNWSSPGKDTRTFIFSVWDGKDPQKPTKKFLDGDKVGDYQIECGHFGGEGTGATCRLDDKPYAWRTGVPYKFLVKIHPAKKNPNNTCYAAAYCGSDGIWHFMGELVYYGEGLWYEGAYSFLECFSPAWGDLNRKVYFGKMGFISKNKKWYPINQANFSTDSAGNNKERLDFGGGATDDLESFYLENDGFFNDFTDPGQQLFKKISDEPQIDVDQIFPNDDDAE